METTTIGLDLAKHVFQVHGITADGSTQEAVAARQASRMRVPYHRPFVLGILR